MNDALTLPPAAPSPRLVAFIGATVISFSAILYRLSDADAVTGGFFRMAYAAPVLGLIAWLQRHRDQRPARDRWIAFAAGLVLGFDVLAWQVAIDQIGAGLATLVANSQVVLVPLVTWALFREHPGRRTFVAMPMVIVGLAAVTGLGSADAFGARPVFGVIMGAAAALFYTTFLVGYRRAGRALSPAAGPLLDATLGAGVTIGIVGVITGDLVLAPTWPGHGWLLLLAWGAQVTGWLAISHALPRLPATVTSFVILLQPTLTLFWGGLIFDERPGLIQLIGVALVISGITWVATERNRTAPPTSTPSPKPDPSRQ